MGQVDKALAAAARLLAGARVEGLAVRGERDGVTLTFRVSYAPPGWSVSAQTGDYPMIMALSPLYQGDPAFELVLGDPAFDDAFYVEGAPEDVVRRLLGPAERARLVALAASRVQLAAGELTLRKDYHYYFAEPDHIEAAIELAASIAGGVRAAFADAERALVASAPRTGDPYRPGPDAESIRRVQAERRRQLAALDQRLRRRKRAHRRYAALCVGAGLFYVIIVVGTLLGP